MLREHKLLPPGFFCGCVVLLGGTKSAFSLALWYGVYVSTFWTTMFEFAVWKCAISCMESVAEPLGHISAPLAKKWRSLLVWDSLIWKNSAHIRIDQGVVPGMQGNGSLAAEKIIIICPPICFSCHAPDKREVSKKRRNLVWVCFQIDTCIN